MSQVEAVGFDYTGVVGILPKGDFFDEMAAIAGTNAQAVRDSYNSRRRNFQVGNIDHRQLWSGVAEELGISDSFDSLWRHAIDRLPTSDPQVLDIVDELRSRNIKVGMLSNLATPTAWSRELYDSGTAAHFDVVLLSGDIGYVKPELPAFELLAQKLGVEPSKLVFIDDREEALKGIDKLGIKPIRYIGVGPLRQSLTQLGIAAGE